MKNVLCRGLLCAVMAAGSVVSVQAAALTWDADTVTAGAQDGGGTWQATGTNWWNGVLNVNWNSATPDTATFGAGGTATTVSLGAAISAGSITFASAASGNYLVRSNTLSLVGTAPFIQSDRDATITSIMAATNGFTKTGASTLFLQNATNTIRGNLSINAGTISVGNNGGESQAALGTATVTITNGATLKFVPGSSAVNFFFTNNIVLNGGTIWGDDGQQHLAGSSMLVGANGGTLTVRWDTKSLYVDAPLSGSGPLAINQANNNTTGVRFSNPASTYSGTITVNGSNAKLDHNRALTNATLNLLVANGLTFNTGITAPVIGGLSGFGNLAIGGVNLSVGNNNAATTYGGVLSGAGNLTKIGTGALTLTNAQTMTGTMNVNNGTLALAAAAPSASFAINGASILDLSAAAPFNAAAGQTFSGHGGLVTGSVNAADGTIIVGGTQGTPGTLTFANDLVLSPGFTNYFDLTNSLTAGAGINDLLVINGDFEPLGSSIAINPKAPLLSGSYRLIEYGTSALGVTFSAVSGNTARDAWTIDTNTTGQVNLLVSAGTNQLLQWTGGTGTDWDGGATNWFSLTSSVDDRFFDMDQVLFDDSGATVNTVNVLGTVKPQVWTVNSASNYTISGAGRISDGYGYFAPLTKDGAGTLVLALTNDFTGGATINAGTALAAADAAFGTGMIVLNGGTLGAADGSRTLANAVRLNGASAGFDDQGATLRLNGVISGTSTVTKTGLGTLAVAAANTYTGTTVVSKGTVQVFNNAGLGTSSAVLGDVNTGSDAVSLLLGNQRNLARPITVSALAGGTVTLGHDQGPGTGAVATVFSGLITLERDVTLDSGNQSDRLSFDGVITGTGNVSVVGTKRITLGGTNNFVGNVSISGSNTVLQTFNALGSIPDASDVDVGAYTIFQINQPDAIDALTGSGFVQPIAANPTLTLGAAGGSGTFSGIFRNNGANFLPLLKSGAGTQTLSGESPMTNGSLTIAAGTLALTGSGAVTGIPLVLVQGGATLDVTARPDFTLANNQILYGRGLVTGDVKTAAGAQIRPDGANSINTLTFGNSLGLNAGSTNLFDLSDVLGVGGGTNDLVAVGGLLEPSNSVVQINPVRPLASGTYTLFTYNGTKTTTFNTNVLGNTTRKVWTLDETTPGLVNLVVTGAYASLVWNPVTSTNWDLTSTNWFVAADSTTGVFVQADSVLFDDSGAFSNVVNLVTQLRPLSFTVNASSNYTVSGSGKISGTTGLLKDGTGTLTMGGTANDYSGEVIITNGTLKAGTASALGATSGVTKVYGNGTLDVNGQNLGQEVVQIEGTGFGGNGTIVNSGAAQTLALQYVKLMGDATVGGASRYDIRSGTAAYLDLAGFTLTKVGPNQFSLVDATCTNAGDMVVNAGVLSLEVSSAVRGPGSIRVNPTGMLQLYQATTAITKPIVVGTGMVYCANASTIGSPIQLNGLATFNTGGGALGITNVISGAGALIKTNANTLNLTGENTYSGGTLVLGGELQIGNNSASGSIVGTITNLANVYFYRTNAVTLTSPIVGTGNVYLRTTGGMTIDSNSPIAIGGNFNVGQNFPARLILTNGASVLASNTINIAQAGSAYVQIHDGCSLTTRAEMLLGNNANNILYFGDMTQYGGAVSVLSAATGEAGMRIGHYPGEVSIYRLLGGTLDVTNAANGTSGLYLGIDGVGILDVQAGVINAKQLFVDGRGNTAAVNGTNEQLIVTGGRINLGSGGLTTGGSGDVYLGGGILGALTNWTSGTGTGLVLQLTGTNGNFVVDSDVWTITQNFKMTGVGGLHKVGAGTLSLTSNSNNFSGGIIVSNGTLQAGASGNATASVLPPGRPVTVRSGATLRLAVTDALGYFGGNPSVVLLDGGTQTVATNLHCSVSTYTLNAGRITSEGAGDASGNYILDGTITTLANASTSIIDCAAASLRGGAVLSPVRFDVANGAADVDLSASARFIDVAGAGMLTKLGAGTMALHATNTYSGATFVSNGTLLVHGIVSTGGLSVAAGATLGGTGFVNGAVGSAGTVAPGASVGVLTVASYAQGTGATLAIEIASAADSDRLDVTGAATLAGTLAVSLLDAYAPTTNDLFVIATVGGGYTGAFAATNLPALSGGDAWVVTYSSGLIMLSVTNVATPPATGYDLAALGITNGLTGYQQDADGDGFANLLEYATGGSLTNGDTLANMSGTRTNGLLALQFSRNTNAVDATLIVEGSFSATNEASWLGIATNSGGSWGAATNVVSAGTNSPISETVFDTEATSTNRFLRLRVTRP